MALSFFCTFVISGSSQIRASSVTFVRLVPVITAFYGHCDVLQGSRSVVKKSLHDMIGKFFALENEPTLSLFNCQMPDFAQLRYLILTIALMSP